MIVNPFITSLLWMWLTFWALLAYLFVRFLIRIWRKDWNPKHQWRIFAAVSIFMILPGTLYLQVFHPSGAGYSKETADYWIGRAVGESERSRKVSHLAQVAQTPKYGPFIAKGAIGRVESSSERCLLRTILAELPNIPDRSEFQREAKEECDPTRKP